MQDCACRVARFYALVMGYVMGCRGVPWRAGSLEFHALPTASSNLMTHQNRARDRSGGRW
jgi:hypothetical protein